jgi:predicted glycosyltransferase
LTFTDKPLPSSSAVGSKPGEPPAGGKTANAIWDSLQKTFGRILDESSQKQSVRKAVELLRNPDLKEIGRRKRSVLLKEKIDVTALLVWFAET